ncbi:tail fiber domain-containing protein [uncultured Pontibacter sp.]|uniref:tail fiber domain-containing protein n=1 Tax=uncultured Pontibacter sp. TaxID=453356 RepID=UPI00261C03C6|nr:tail fiber domain-containing protein [uncultured Pontibacter sp.]
MKRHLTPINSGKIRALFSMLLVIFALGYGPATLGQSTGVRIGTSPAASPDPSAMLDISAADKGLLIPRLTEVQRQAIASPATGLMVFQTDGSFVGFWYYVSPSGWTSLSPGGDNLGNHTATQNLNLSDKVLVGQTTPAAAIGTTGLRVDSDGKVNIGTKREAPVYAGLEEHTGAGILSTGTFKYDGNFNSIAGAGTRLLWSPERAAFRVGQVSGDQWDGANVGRHSVGMGSDVVASGNNAIALGNGTRATGENSFASGQDATASGHYSTAIGSRVSTGIRQGAVIIGDHSNPETITTSYANNTMTMRFAGGYSLYTSANGTSGLELAAGGSSWSYVSDSTRKENFAPVNGEDFLAKIARFKLTSWNYKGQSADSMRHYGPMAQDFYAAFGTDSFGTIGNDTTISQADFDGVNLIAIQALEKRTTELQNQIEQLLLQNATLKAKAEKTDADLQHLQEQMAKLSGELPAGVQAKK